MFLTQIFLNRTETRGTWCELTKESLEESLVLNQEFITNHLKEFEKIFNQIKDKSWIPLIDQYLEKDETRVKLDSAILKVLGYSDTEIQKILPSLYKAIGNEQ